MKKQIDEPDYIGGEGSLTREEEVALSLYFAKKKVKANKHPSNLISRNAKLREAFNTK